MKDKTIKTRDGSLDMFKGFLMICIIFIHITGGKYPISNWINTFKLAGFFFVSGYLLAARFSAFDIKNRIIRIMAPYLVFSVILLGFRFFMVSFNGGISGALEVLAKILRQTVFLTGYSTLWFLPVLIIAEIVFVALLRIRGNCYIIIKSLVVCVLSTVLFFHLLFVSRFYNLQSDALLPWIRSVPALIFLSGGFIFHIITHNVNDKLLWSSIAVIGLIVGYGFSKRMYEVYWLSFCFGDGRMFLLVSSFSVLGFFSFFKLLMALPIEIRVLTWIGRNSLIIMATHHALPFIGISRMAVGLFFGASFLSDALICLGVLVLEIPVVFVYNKIAFMKRICAFLKRSKNIMLKIIAANFDRANVSE